MNGAAFERLVGPALPLLAAAPPVDPKALFADACAARADTGSGWDVPAAGQMSLWAFTEAMLRLAERAAVAAGPGGAGEQSGGEAQGAAPALARLVRAMM